MRYNPAEWSAKLRDPRWQRKRLEKLQQAEWKCCFCSRQDRTLHVHHLQYDGREPWDYTDEELVVLCDKCHESEHSERKDNERRVLTALRLSRIPASVVGQLADAIETMPAPTSKGFSLSAICWIAESRQFLDDLERQFIKVILDFSECRRTEKSKEITCQTGSSSTKTA